MEIRMHKRFSTCAKAVEILHPDVENRLWKPSSQCLQDFPQQKLFPHTLLMWISGIDFSKSAIIPICESPLCGQDKTRAPSNETI